MSENMYDAWDNGDRHEIRQQFARREEIIRMAREAGFDLDMWQLSLGCDAHGTHEELERFAALVAAAEREACARFVAEGYVRQFENPWREDLAAAIRARSEK